MPSPMLSEAICNIYSHANFVMASITGQCANMPRIHGNSEVFSICYVQTGEWRLYNLPSPTDLEKGTVVIYTGEEIPVPISEDIPQKHRCIYMTIKKEFLERECLAPIKKSILPKFPDDPMEQQEERYDLARAQQQHIEQRIQDIINEYEKPGMCHEELLNTQMTQFLISLARYIESIHTTSEGILSDSIDDRFEELMRYIDEHFCEKLTASSVYKQFFISSSVFYDSFRRINGCTFTKYINRKRVAKAMELLDTTNLSVRAIIKQVGFSNNSYFMEVFKSSTGYRPTEYKRRSPNACLSAQAEQLLTMTKTATSPKSIELDDCSTLDRYIQTAEENDGSDGTSKYQRKTDTYPHGLIDAMKVHVGVSRFASEKDLKYVWKEKLKAQLEKMRVYRSEYDTNQYGDDYGDELIERYNGTTKRLFGHYHLYK